MRRLPPGACLVCLSFSRFRAFVIHSPMLGVTLCLPVTAAGDIFGAFSINSAEVMYCMWRQTSIAEAAEAPSFENTVAALERSGKALKRGHGVFNQLSSALTDEALDNFAQDAGDLADEFAIEDVGPALDEDFSSPDAE